MLGRAGARVEVTRKVERGMLSVVTHARLILYGVHRQQAGSATKLLRREEPGAEEGTRTPTPLRVHGPEPCASANSATSALNEAPDKDRRLRREILIYFKGFGGGVKSIEDRLIG